MSTTTNRPARTSAVFDEKGNRLFASVGAVRQGGGSLPLCRCNTCGGEVVWATSKRTGGKYLVSVFYGQEGMRFYRGNALHKC